MASDVLNTIAAYVEASERLSPFEFARCEIRGIPLGHVLAADEWVRVAIARNKTAPMEFLTALAGDPEVRVRSAVASRNTLTPELFERFARDSDDGIRGGLACHKKAPEHILRLLANDPQAWIREKARARLAL